MEPSSRFLHPCRQLPRILPSRLLVPGVAKGRGRMPRPCIAGWTPSNSLRMLFQGARCGRGRVVVLRRNWRSRRDEMDAKDSVEEAERGSALPEPVAASSRSPTTSTHFHLILLRADRRPREEAGGPGLRRKLGPFCSRRMLFLRTWRGSGRGIVLRSSWGTRLTGSRMY